MPQVVPFLIKVGTLVTFGAATGTAAAVIGGIAVVGTFAASRFLKPKLNMNIDDNAGTRSATVRSTTEAQKRVYGETLVSGPITYAQVSGTNNRYLHQVIALAGHELTAIDEIRFDEHILDLTNSSIYNPSTKQIISGKFGPKNNENDVSEAVVYIDTRLGAASQTAYSALRSDTLTSQEYLDTHRGDGIASVYVRMTTHEGAAELWDDVGNPRNIRALVRGAKVYDPRLEVDAGGTAGASPTNASYVVYDDNSLGVGTSVNQYARDKQGQNPALIIADLLMNDDFGLGIPASKIDWSAVITAADKCDQLVVIPTSSVQKRFFASGVVFGSDSHRRSIEKILMAMDGDLLYSQGKYIIKAGVYEAPTETFSENDVVSAVQVKTATPRQDRYNQISGLFIDPNENFKMMEFGPITVDGAYARDNSEVLPEEIKLPFTSNRYAAQRLAWKKVNQSFAQTMIQVTVNLKGMRVRVGDRINLTLTDFESIDSGNWSPKIFKVISWGFAEDGSGVDLTLIEDASAYYADPDEDDYSTIDAQGTITTALPDVPSPSSFTATSQINSILLEWTNPANNASWEQIWVFRNTTGTTPTDSDTPITRLRTTSFTDQRDADGTEYYYWIQAVKYPSGTTPSSGGANKQKSPMIALGTPASGKIAATKIGQGVMGDDSVGTAQVIDGNIGSDQIATTIQSNNWHETNQTGWKIQKDGNAYFNEGAFRGTVTVGGTDLTSTNTLNSNTTASDVGLGNVDNTDSQATTQNGLISGTTITGGGITLSSGGVIKGGQTGYNDTSNAGFFLGYDSNAYKLSIGNGAAESLTFDGSTLSVRGTITADSGSIANSVTVGGTAASTIVADSSAGASVADSPQNSLLPNWQLDIADSNGKPAGIKGVEGLANYTAISPYVYFADSNKNSIRIDSSPSGSSADNNVAFGWPAIPVDDWKKYTVRIRHKSESASLTGLYWRFNEHDGPPDAGTTHIAQYANSGATTARTSFNDLLANGPTGGTTYVEDTYTYTPTAGTKWASFSVYNWDTYSGWIEIDYVSIQEQGYIGGVTITPTKLYQGTGTFNNTNTGFYLDNAGQFSLKDRLSFDGTDLTVSGSVTASSFTLSSGATLSDADDQIKNTNNNAFFRYETTAANDAVDAPTDTQFNTAFGRDPRTRDVIVVVNTASDPDVSAAYIYNGSSWDAKNDFFTGDVIVDGTITADHLSVNSLSAISADMGSITAGSLNINSGAFAVTSSGVMSATGATVSGAITATSLSIPSSGVTGTLTGSNIGTLGSSNVDVDDLVENDSVALSTEPSLQLNYNAMCNLADSSGKPDGLYPVEGVTTLDYITLQTENSGTANEFKFIRIDSSPAGVTTDTTVSYAWKPFVVDSSKNYKLVIRYRAESQTSTGLYLRFNEYNQTSLSSGKTHIGISSGGTNTQARTSFIDVVSNGATPPTTFVEETYLYQPTSGAKLTNFVLYNWSANSGYIDIDFVKVYEINGDADGVTILADRIYQGAGNYQNSDTGFYFDSTGQFSLKDKLFYNPTDNLLTVDGNITADVITAKQNLVVLGDLEASSVAVGSITRAMLSQSALDEIFGSLATSVGGSNGDFKEGTGSFTTSGGSITLGTSSDKFDHGTADVEVEFHINTYFYSTTNYTTAQAQATLTFEATADGTFNDLNSADKTHTLQFLEYDLSSYYGYTYLVYYINTAITKTFTSGSGNDLADNTDVQFRVAVSGVGSAFTGQTLNFEASANEGVTGVTSTGGNADTLDNLDSTAFLRSNVDDTFDANLTVTGNLDVTGDLNITGDINSYNVTDLDVTDKTITVNSGGTQSNSNGSGLIVDRGTAVDGYIKWDETNDRFNFSHAIFAGRTVSDQGTVSYTNNAATFSSLGVTHTDSESNVLRLMRDGTSGVVYAGLADFDLSRWESSDVASRTALSLKLGHGNLNTISSTTVPTVVTFKSDKSTEFKGSVLAEASARVEGVKGSGSGTYTWPDSMLTVRDTESLQTGVGGGVIFEGKYTSSNYTTTGSISTEKDNGTSLEYGYSTVIRTRQNGAGLNEVLRLSSTKVATFAGNVDINGTTLEVGDGGTNGVIDVKATTNAYFKVNGTTELTLKPSSAEFADVVMAPTGKFGTTSDNVSAIVYVKSVGSANLQRWGTGDDNNANSYRFRIDQNFKFIGNNGSTDKVVIDSDTGNIDSSGQISADGIIYSGSSSGTPQIGQIRALASASAYVGATNDADKTVFMGVDSSSYGIVGTLSNYDLGFRTNNTLRWLIDTNGDLLSQVAGNDLVLSGQSNGSGNIVLNTNGGVFLRSSQSEANNWLFKENASQWGIFYLNAGSEAGASVGNYTTVGAEYFFTSSVSGYGPAMPSTWTGYQSGSYLNVMLSPWRGYIYAGDQIEAKNQIRTTGTFVLSGTTEIDVDDNTGVVLGAVRDADWVVRSGIGGKATGNGDTWAIGHNNTNLYFGIGNGSSVNSLSTYMIVDPSRVIYMENKLTVGDETYNDGNLHVYSEGTNTDLVIDNRKTYGSGQGTADRARLIFSLSENDTSVSAQDRHFFRIEAGTLAETSSADGFAKFYVRQSGTPIEVMQFRNSGAVSISGDGTNYVAAMQRGALELGSTSRNYKYTSGWSSTMQAGILANTAENWEFAVHDAGDSVNSIFCYEGTGANTAGTIVIGREMGWGRNQLTIEGPILATNNGTGTADSTITLKIGKTAAGYKSMKITDHTGSGDTWFNYTDGSNYITHTGGKNYLRYYNGSTYSNTATFDNSNVYLLRKTTITTDGTGSTNGSVLNVVGSTYNQVNINHSGGTSWGLLIGYGDGSLTTGYHGDSHAAIINVQAAPLHLGVDNDSNMRIRSDGAVEIDNRLYLEGGAYFNHTANTVTSISNADAGATNFSNRGNRLLTSNGTSWLADGRDPMFAFTENTTATTIGGAIGITMHNEQSTTSAMSPMIAFSAKSDSGSYNSAYAGILGRKIGTGVDTNWNAGELWFYAMPQGVYASNYPTMQLVPDGLNIHGSSGRNADTSLFIHGHGEYDPCIFLFNHLSSPSEGLEIWYDNSTGHSYITNKFSSGNIRFGTQTGSALKSTSNTRFEITGAGDLIFGGQDHSPYISATNENTLNAGWNQNVDTADLWINYRGYQDGTTRFRDFRIGNGKNAELVHLDGSANRWYWSNGTEQFNWEIHADSDSASGSWDNLNFQATTEWGDSGSYGVLGGSVGVMLRRPHVVWNSSAAASDIRFGRSGGVSSGTWYNLGTKASDVFFIGKENANLLTHDGSITWDFQSNNIATNGTIKFQNSTSRQIAGESVNSRNTVSIYGNWDTFHVMGRVLDWSASNLHFGDGYNGVNHSSYYVQFGTNSGGTNGLNYFRVGTDIYADGNVIAYYSDARLKQKVETIPNALDIVRAIRGVYFEWNELSEKVWSRKAGEKDFGLISQEVEAVFPMGVAIQCAADKAKEMGYSDPESEHYDPLHHGDNEEEEYKTVKYDKMVAVAIQAINEQQSIIEEQQAQIDELKSLVNKLLEK